MGIAVEQVRIHGLRGLMNLEVNLEDTTVLMGMNNSGKTSFLKGLQIAFGNSQFITREDFNVSEGTSAHSIIIDTKIVPTDDSGNRCSDFSEEWETLFKEDRIMVDDKGDSSVQFRTTSNYDPLSAGYRTRQFVLNEWPPFGGHSVAHWYESKAGNEKSFRFEEIPFFYVDAQRDILEDMKMRTSYLGRMISKIEYSEKDVKAIEKQIRELNERAVSSSTILTNIRDTLKQLNSAMDSKNDGVEITPFAKKIRDLNRSITIAYGESKETFTMEYHGMGTRSWSSLLTLKSFIDLRYKYAKDEHSPFFPILAVEEPEAHLHPNAQKRLFDQIDSIHGQKIISTHSPYIAACAKLHRLRNFYKDDSTVKCGTVDTSLMDPEDIRKVERHVINSKGEIFFSKAIVLSEGETEEQALPILAEKFFERCPHECGINFAGVGGCGGYLPFMRIAESFRIPWFVFSDGEDATKKKLAKDIKELKGVDVDLNSMANVFILEHGHDFERHLIEGGYIEEISQALEKIREKEHWEQLRAKKNGTPAKQVRTDKVCDACKQAIYEGELRDYSGNAGFKRFLYDCMVKMKTRIGPILADCIVQSKSALPQKVKQLFDAVRPVVHSGGKDGRS